MRIVLTLITALLVPIAAEADPIVIPKSRQERPRLKSVYSAVHEVSELKRSDTKMLVFVFTGVDCPVAQLYMPRLRELHEKYLDQGVHFYGVYPNRRVHVTSMATHAHDQDIPFPVFLDMDHRLADLLDAEVTPEVVVLDANWEKRYQGAIDNQFKKQGRLQEVSENYLEDAIKQVLAGETIAESRRPPTGCPIERMGPPEPNKDLTFYRDVAPILQKNCENCHRDGGVGPFEIVTYEDAYYLAGRIRENVLERRMPPWHGFLNPKFGKLRNDKRLSEEDIRTIDEWVRIGSPKGTKADAPAPINWPDPDAWDIGKPDYVFSIPGFEVPKTGVLDYQFFRVKLGFERDRWFQAVEVKPGNAEVVHHIGLHVVPASSKVFSGFSGMAELYGLNGEGAILINDYVPGDTYNAKQYSPEQAVRVPENSDLIFELHYTPNNREAIFDRSKVAFTWAPKPPKEEVFTKVFRRPIGRFQIPPHVSHHRKQDSYYFEHDVLLDAVRPHFHLRAKSFRLEVIVRDEDTEEIAKRETVLSVPVWDQDWQRTYEFEAPLFLPAGSELLATAHFDNSYLNPNNPDPSATVQYGQQTTDEMFSVRFKYRVAPKADVAEAGK